MGDDVPIFGGSGDAFGGNGLLLFFDDVSIHKYGQIIIYHHCICLFGRLFNIVIWSSGHMVIWSSCYLIIWSSCQYGHMVIWSSGQYGHLVNMVIWSSSHFFICSSVHLVNVVIRSSGHLVI